MSYTARRLLTYLVFASAVLAALAYHYGRAPFATQRIDGLPPFVDVEDAEDE